MPDGVGRGEGWRKDDRELGNNEGIESAEKVDIDRPGVATPSVCCWEAARGGGARDAEPVVDGEVAGVQRSKSWSRYTWKGDQCSATKVHRDGHIIGGGGGSK